VTSAQASVIFDFGAIANGPLGTEGPFNNSAGYATEGGITVQAGPSSFPVLAAYLDSSFNSNPAGLGVCSGFSGTECDPSSDDNVTSGETLTLSFFDAATMNPLMVVLNPTFFRDSLHFKSYAMMGQSVAAPIALEVAKCRWPSRVHWTPFPAIASRWLADTVLPAVWAPFSCSAKTGGSQ